MGRIVLEDEGNSPLGRMPVSGRVVTLPLVSQRAEDVVTRAGGDRTLLGLALLGAGGVWLVGEMGLFHVAGRTLESVALVCIGAGLIITRRSGRRIWPVLVGGILAVSLLGSSATTTFRSRFGTGFGAHSFAPKTLGAVQSRYQTGFGSLTLDLSQVSFPDTGRTIHVDVGFGRMQVIVPDHLLLRVNATGLAGSVSVFGGHHGGGLGVDESYQDPLWTTDHTTPRLTLDLNVAGGAVSVERAPPS